jgi:hypothetical protein
MLSAVMALNFVAQGFVQDYPPRAVGASDDRAEARDSALMTGELLRQKKGFWASAIDYGASVRLGIVPSRSDRRD